MTNLLLRLSHVAFWLLWPAFYILLRNTQRTRVLLITGDAVLVVKTWFSDGKWSLPGGGVHNGEDIKIGAAREVYEELGITIDHHQLRHHGKEAITSSGIPVMFIRYSTVLKHKPAVSKQWYEVSHAAWVPLKDLNEDNTDPSVLRHISAWRADAN